MVAEEMITVGSWHTSELQSHEGTTSLGKFCQGDMRLGAEAEKFPKDG